MHQKEDMNGTIMEEVATKKEKSHQYNVYTLEARKRCFCYLKEKLMKPREAAQAANVNYDTARKWKKTYEEDPDRRIPTKKTNIGSSRPISQLGEDHKRHLINFFDEDASATIQDPVDDLASSFAGSKIKKSRVAEFMKEECNPSIKVVTRHPAALNREGNLQARVDWVN